MKFEEIHLTKSEIKLLRRLKKRFFVGLTTDNEKDYGILKFHGFAKHETNVDKTYTTLTITDLGHRYLSYHSQETLKWKLPIVLSVVALIVSVVAIVVTIIL